MHFGHLKLSTNRQFWRTFLYLSQAKNLVLICYKMDLVVFAKGYTRKFLWVWQRQLELVYPDEGRRGTNINFTFIMQQHRKSLWILIMWRKALPLLALFDLYVSIPDFQSFSSIAQHVHFGMTFDMIQAMSNHTNSFNVLAGHFSNALIHDLIHAQKLLIGHVCIVKDYSSVISAFELENRITLAKTQVFWIVKVDGMTGLFAIFTSSRL